MKKIQILVLALIFSSPLPLIAQEARLGTTDLPDAVAAESPLAKQIARDKQLLEIWKDHVRTLTRERDEAYQKIQDLQQQAASAPAAVPAEPDTAALDAANAQIETLKDKIQSLEENQRKNQFAVETQPLPGGSPASQKFYADLSRNFMKQQETIKNLKSEVARLEAEQGQYQAQREENANSAGQIQDLESQAARAEERLGKANAEIARLENLLNQIQADNTRLKERAEKAGEWESKAAQLQADRDNFQKDYDQAVSEVEDLESQKAAFQDQVRKLESEIAPLNQDRERSLRQAAEAKLRLEDLTAKHTALEATVEKVTAENRQVWGENQKLNAQNKELSSQLQTEAEKSRQYEGRLKESLAELAQARQEADETNKAQQSQIESLQTRLKANAADVQNLKENFNTLLEPLVSSFDERQ